MRPVISEAAWGSLDSLAEYWSDTNSDERTLQKVDELLEAVLWLASWPGAGTTELYLEHKGRLYRKWTVGNVKIIFFVHVDELRVVDFFDARQDPRKMKGRVPDV